MLNSKPLKFFFHYHFFWFSYLQTKKIILYKRPLWAHQVPAQCHQPSWFGRGFRETRWRRPPPFLKTLMSIDTYLSQKTYWCSFTQQWNHEIVLAFSFSILWNLSYQSSAPCYLIKLILYLHNPCSNQHALAQFSTLLLNSARYCSIQHAHAQFSTLLSQISTLFLKSARSILISRFF